MPTKLPPYFEKYFENKFGEVWSRFDLMDKKIDELKKHVNDEIEEIKKRTYKNENNIKTLVGVLFLMTPIYIKDIREVIIKAIFNLLGV